MALSIDTNDEDGASTAIADMQVLAFFPAFSPFHDDNIGQLAQMSAALPLRRASMVEGKEGSGT